MPHAATEALRSQLEDRRDRLHALIQREGPDADFVRLLRQVDSVLARMDTEDYGRCLVCSERVEERDLRVNPMLEYCLCEWSDAQRQSLQKDLDLARRIQVGLLPDPDLAAAGWEASYRYEPAGAVSGDYCDLWTGPGRPEEVYFAIGDVSGKGIAASLLMAHLQSAFRSLVGAGVPLGEVAPRVNRQLLEARIPTHYATLAFGRAGAEGRLEVVNAGHCPPRVLRRPRGRPDAPRHPQSGLKRRGRTRPDPAPPYTRPVADPSAASIGRVSRARCGGPRGGLWLRNPTVPPHGGKSPTSPPSRVSPPYRPHTAGDRNTGPDQIACPGLPFHSTPPVSVTRASPWKT